MKIFNKEVIPIFLTLLILTLLSIIPSCALADDQNMPHSSGSGESFDPMKARMMESVNVTIENLESSKVNLDNESTREAAEKLITDLKSIKEEISDAKTEDDLIKIRQELDTLFNTAPEELKSTPGLLPYSMGRRPGMQSGDENFSQGFKNLSEIRPEMMNNGSQPPGMVNDGSQPPGMMNNRNQPGDLNATMNGSERPGPSHAGMEGKNNSANSTAENGSEKMADSGFLGSLFGGLMNALKSLFS